VKPIRVVSRCLFATLLVAAAASAQSPDYRTITDPAESAQPVALEILKHLAAGELERAAELSNAPGRRLEVLHQFMSSVGKEEFRRLFARYFAPQNRVVLEAAIGARRLLVWDLGEANNQLAGQYYIQRDGKFLMDDIPSEERSRLQRVLEAMRNPGSR